MNDCLSSMLQSGMIQKLKKITKVKLGALSQLGSKPFRTQNSVDSNKLYLCFYSLTFTLEGFLMSFNDKLFHK